MKLIDSHIEFLVLGMYFILYGFDLLFEFQLEAGEVVIGNKSGKQFFLGCVALLLKHHFLRIESFLFFVYDFFATAVYFIDLGDHTLDERRGEFNKFEKVGDLLFQVPDFHIFVRAFYLIAGPVAVIIRFIFLGVMLGGVSLSADGAESETSEYEIKLLPTAGVSVVLGHYELGTFPCFFADQGFMFSCIHQPSPSHFSVVERIFKHLDHLAVSQTFAGVSPESFFIQNVADFIDRIISGHVHVERFLDKRRTFFVHNYDSLFLVARIAGVQISVCDAGRPPAIPELLLKTL